MFGLTTFLRQTDPNNCGILALEMIAQYHGMPATYEEIKRLVLIEKQGIHLQSLLAAAEKIGFSAKGMKGSYDAIGSIHLPAIAHIKTDKMKHFVVLQKWDSNVVVISDYDDGVRQQSRVEFCAHWTGYLLVVEPHQQPL